MSFSKIRRLLSVGTRAFSFLVTYSLLCEGATIGLTYIGNNYTDCNGTYCVGGPNALKLNVQTALPPGALNNLPYSDFTSSVTGFAFSDGSGLVLDNSNAHSPAFRLSTDASGAITSWFMVTCGADCETQMQTNWNTVLSFHPGRDFSETTSSFAGSYGFVSNSSGSWTTTFNDLQGGTSSAPVFLVSGTPISSILGTIGGTGSEEYYVFLWAGGAFSATASITGATGGASYLFSSGAGSTCNGVASSALNSNNGFTSTISVADLAPGQYCIGLLADSLTDPNFTLTFNTPVSGGQTPEPTSVILVLSGVVLLSMFRRRNGSEPRGRIAS